MMTSLILIYVVGVIFGLAFLFRYSKTIMADSFSTCMMICVAFFPLANIFFLVMAFAYWAEDRQN